MPERWTKSSKKWPKQLIFSQLKSTLNIKEQKKITIFWAMPQADGRTMIPIVENVIVR
jgi:hypothetical protein